MLSVQREVQTRILEIERYFAFLNDFDLNRVDIKTPANEPASVAATSKGELFKTLKANGFLLLYNLVEATLRNSIEAIFDELKVKNISFDACRREVRHIVLENLRKHNVAKILPTLSSVAIDMVVATFRKDQLFHGNVDGRKVQDVAKQYGFKKPRNKSNELLTVKSNRNDLAHGNKTFAEVGRDYDVARLAKIQQEVVAFLNETLSNISDYISNQEYLL